MTLVVLGKESLSQLQRAVDVMFAPVPNRGTGRKPSEKWIGKVKPFFNNQPLQAYNIVPVQVGRFVCSKKYRGKICFVVFDGGHLHQFLIILKGRKAYNIVPVQLGRGVCWKTKEGRDMRFVLWYLMVDNSINSNIPDFS